MNGQIVAKIALNRNIEAFIVYITFFSLELNMIIHLSWKTEIASLNIKKVFKNILAKYLDFINIFQKINFKTI